MDSQDIQQIKQLVDALTSLRDWEVNNLSIDIEAIERLVPSGMDRTNRIAQRIGLERDEITRPHKMKYRKMVEDLLDDDAWDRVASILEAYNPQTAERLDGIRRIILDQVSSDVKLARSVGMHGQKLGPNDASRKTIQRLICALKDIPKQESNKVQGKDGQGNIDKNENLPRSWLWRLYETTLKVLVNAVLERFWPKPK
jgi:hypothetical protein